MSPRYDVPERRTRAAARGAAVREQHRPGARGRLAARLAGRARARRLSSTARSALREALRALVAREQRRCRSTTGAVETFNAARRAAAPPARRIGPRAGRDGRRSRSTGSSRSPRCDARRHLASAQGVPHCRWSFYDRSPNRSGDVVLDAALRQPREDARVPDVVSRRRVGSRACGRALRWAASPSRPARAGA